MRGLRARLQQGIRAFLAMEAAGALPLALGAVLAILLANSTYSSAYEAFLHASIGGLSLEHLINDILMSLFFLLVGLELKRELLRGELASPRKALLPVVAALGGMAGPALVYRFWNPAGVAAHGWGIPMATDIAFALGALSLCGKRVPLALKAFLLALAIADDLGAVLVIALFYGTGIAWLWLLGAGLLALAFAALVRLRGAPLAAYLLQGALLWWLFSRAGVHPTLAGVALAAVIPLEESRGAPSLGDWEATLHPWVSFGVMPLFALVNSGVSFQAVSFMELIAHPVALGVAAGLVMGKPLGILLATWLAVATGLGHLPRGLRWAEVAGMSILGGIGFTVALFVARLALPADLELFARAGILAGSLAAAVLGWAALSLALRAQPHK